MRHKVVRKLLKRLRRLELREEERVRWERVRRAKQRRKQTTLSAPFQASTAPSAFGRQTDSVSAVDGLESLVNQGLWPLQREIAHAPTHKIGG